MEAPCHPQESKLKNYVFSYTNEKYKIYKSGKAVIYRSFLKR